MQDVYAIITNRMVTLLEKGTVPWHQPWRGPDDAPKNLVSGREYRGINALVLATAGYSSSYWLTFKQARERGGSVKKGEHGFPCVFWKWLEIEDTSSMAKKRIPFARCYTVFSVEQCEGVPYPQNPPACQLFSSVEDCERIVSAMPNPPTIEHRGNHAYYSWNADTVVMPLRTRFENPESYYSTLFHELIHATGYKSRLSRFASPEEMIFASESYSKEELVAEMGSAFLCGQSGIENRIVENSASYIASWLKQLKDDKRLVVHAAAQAQKAADYILNNNKEGTEEDDKTT